MFRSVWRKLPTTDDYDCGSEEDQYQNLFFWGEVIMMDVGGDDGDCIVFDDGDVYGDYDDSGVGLFGIPIYRKYRY